MIVSESGGSVVVDARDMQGHLAAEESMKIAIARAREHGVAAVAVRNGFHFGVAGRYARMAADEGCVAIVMCNSNPVMPPPGGVDKLHGTNPLSIGLPTRDGPPIILDMASTAGTVGKIRYAAAAGDPIPEGWALDPDGRPTTDAARALGGTLLPVGGPKGFGLSMVIDLLSGLLASGGWGPHLSTMRGDLDKRFNSSFLFIVLDIAHFRPLESFLDEAQAGAERVRNSRKAEGTERLFTPGEQSAEAIGKNSGRIRLTASVAKSLKQKADELNVPLPDFLHS
jgi:LDH2 family malate/lactate/ureidoglycolate dehydrogenase